MRARLFILACVLGGVGAFVGSAIGGMFGNRALFVGAVIGGLLVAPLTARVALWRKWITPSQSLGTTIGAAIGFLVAAFVAVNTMGRAVGPVLSTALIGVGAVVGSRRA